MRQLPHVPILNTLEMVIKKIKQKRFSQGDDASELLAQTTKTSAELLAKTTQESAELLSKSNELSDVILARTTKESAELLARTTQESADLLRKNNEISEKLMRRLTAISVVLGLIQILVAIVALFIGFRLN